MSRKDKAILVIGAGRHAGVLLDILLDQETTVAGILDKDRENVGCRVLGVPVIGTDDDIDQYPPEEYELVNAIGSSRSTAIRRMVYENYKRKGYRFHSAIHPRACISRRAVLGEGVQVMAGAVINVGAVIGEDAIINTRASIDHDCRIGAHVHIAPGCVLSGNVTVGDGTHIGTGSAVIQQVTIGSDTLIGAGSAVVKDIPSHVTAYGVPARVVVDG